MEEMKTEHAAALRKKETQVTRPIRVLLVILTFPILQIMQLNTLITQFKQVHNT